MCLRAIQESWDTYTSSLITHRGKRNFWGKSNLKVKVLVTQLCLTLVTSRTVVQQAPLSLVFRQESGVGSHCLL